MESSCEEADSICCSASCDSPPDVKFDRIGRTSGSEYAYSSIALRPTSVLLASIRFLKNRGFLNPIHLFQAKMFYIFIPYFCEMDKGNEPRMIRRINARAIIFFSLSNLASFAEIHLQRLLLSLLGWLISSAHRL